MGRIYPCDTCMHVNICKYKNEVGSFLKEEQATDSVYHKSVSCDAYKSQYVYETMIKTMSECTDAIMKTLDIPYIVDPVSGSEALKIMVDKICATYKQKKRRIL